MMNESSNQENQRGEVIVIDLTNSFTLNDRRRLADSIKEFIDDTLSNSPIPNRNRPPRRSSARLIKKKKDTSSSVNQKLHNKPKGLRDCPICWEELGKKKIGSTKCGHVFCLSCIEQVLHHTKQCPTCRCVLKGPRAYHPLYL